MLARERGGELTHSLMVLNHSYKLGRGPSVRFVGGGTGEAGSGRPGDLPGHLMHANTLRQQRRSSARGDDASLLLGQRYGGMRRGRGHMTTAGGSGQLKYLHRYRGLCLLLIESV